MVLIRINTKLQANKDPKVALIVLLVELLTVVSSSISSVRFSMKLHHRGAGPNDGTKKQPIRFVSRAMTCNHAEMTLQVLRTQRVTSQHFHRITARMLSDFSVW